MSLNLHAAHGGSEHPMPEINTVWRHYGGSHYAVVGHCRLESTNEAAVLYRKNGVALVWVRPVAEWYADVAGTPRFVREDFEKDGP